MQSSLTNLKEYNLAVNSAESVILSQHGKRRKVYVTKHLPQALLQTKGASTHVQKSTKN